MAERTDVGEIYDPATRKLDEGHTASCAPRRHHRRGSCGLYVRLRRRERAPTAGPDPERLWLRPPPTAGPRCRICPSPSTALRCRCDRRPDFPARPRDDRAGNSAPPPCRCTARPCAASDCVWRSHFESAHRRGPVHEHVHRCGAGIQLPSGDEEAAVAGYVVVGGVVGEQRCGK